MEMPRIPDYLTTEYPAQVDFNLHDMEFYTGHDINEASKKAADATLDGLTELTSPHHHHQAINLTIPPSTAEETKLFDEFIALVESSHRMEQVGRVPAASEASQQAGSVYSVSPGEQENIVPGKAKKIQQTPAGTGSQTFHQRPAKGASGSPQGPREKQHHHQMANRGEGGGSLLRQQLQGTLCTGQYNRRAGQLQHSQQQQQQQEASYNCSKCRQPLTAKCILGTCLKSDEVLCPSCGQELTAKCLMDMCSRQQAY